LSPPRRISNASMRQSWSKLTVCRAVNTRARFGSLSSAATCPFRRISRSSGLQKPEWRYLGSAGPDRRDGRLMDAMILCRCGHPSSLHTENSCRIPSSLMVRPSTRVNASGRRLRRRGSAKPRGSALMAERVLVTDNSAYQSERARRTAAARQGVVRYGIYIV
jgi:hypothetical protein